MKILQLSSFKQVCTLFLIIPLFIFIVTDDGDHKQDSRKRKHKATTNATVSKKKSTDDVTSGGEGAGNELSSQDKELLERWSKMQKDTTPFVHPIRNHMNELLQLKVETIQQQKLNQPLQQQNTLSQTSSTGATTTATTTTTTETVKGQRIVNRVCSTKTANNSQISTLQFTNLVPKTKNGNYSLVAESTVVITTAASSNLSLPTTSQHSTTKKPTGKVTTAVSSAAAAATTTLTGKAKATTATIVVSGATGAGIFFIIIVYVTY